MIQGNSDGPAQEAGRDMSISQPRASQPDSSKSLSIARSVMLCGCCSLSAHCQTLLLIELNWGIAFSSLSRW